MPSQVKEAHQLLESFATWASKTEAALTLFVPWSDGPMAEDVDWECDMNDRVSTIDKLWFRYGLT